MNKCKDCKYFIRNDGEYNSIKYGECKSDKFIYETSYELKEKEIADKLLYMDDEWYGASFEVGEDFGCIHFKRRNNTDEN